MGENKKDFKPYVPAEKVTPEFTVTSIIMGIILAVVFGAANAYLGLRGINSSSSYLDGCDSSLDEEGFHP